MVDDYFVQNDGELNNNCTMAVIDENKILDVMSKFEE
jgi:hypothetical protein